MKDKEQQETYQKYMTPAPIPDKTLETCKAELSGEEALEMGHRYFKGLGVEQDYEKAVECYEEAAEQEIADAFLALGFCYRDGKGVKASLNVAKRYFEYGASVQRFNICRSMEPEGSKHYLDARYKEILFQGSEKICEISNIEKIVFSDSINENIETYDYKDISQEKDGSIVGWVEKQEKDGRTNYILHVEGNGKINAPGNSNSLFGGFTGVEEIVFKDGFNTENTYGMNRMFDDCSRLVSVDVSRFDTANVIDMGGMFVGCSRLISVDVSGFDTANVIDMRGMFFGCSRLISVDVSGFDTANVINMSNMFFGCSLISVDVSGFDTANVIDMNGMFSACNSLISVDVSGFDTANVLDMSCMFYHCESLSELDVSKFDTSKVKNMEGMFGFCENLSELDVSGFNTSNVTNMSAMFEGCSSLKILDTSHFDMKNVEERWFMFDGCDALFC